MSCGQQVVISGLPHLVFRCCREKGHAGQPHAISVGSDLLKRLRGDAARASAR